MATESLQKNIPKGWFKTTIASECDLLRGRGLSKSDIDPLGKNKCLLYGELFTKYGEIIREVESRTNSKEGVKSEKGDVLIPGSTTTVAKDLAIASSLQESDVLLGGDINILRQKKSSYDPNFLAYYLTHHKNKELSSYAQGITIIHLSINKFKDLEICIPESANEQKKIAEILGTVDDEIQKTEEIIAATDKLKKGLMRQLFTRGIGHTKFKKTKIGEIPVEWGLSKLRDVAKFTNGKAHEKDIKEDGKYIVINSKFISTNGEVVKHSDKNLSPLVVGDIAMVMSDIPKGKALTKCFLVDENNKYTLNQRICSLQAIKIVDKFLYYILNRNPYFLGFDNGVGQTNLRKDEVLNCPIQVPPKDEQRKIVELFSSLDEKIAVNKKLKAELIILKKGLMQDLLSGKKRTI